MSPPGRIVFLIFLDFGRIIPAFQQPRPLSRRSLVELPDARFYNGRSTSYSHMSKNSEFPVLPPGPAEPIDLEKEDDKLGVMGALWQEYGDCYRVHSRSRGADTWVINDPALIKPVLVSRHRNYSKGVGIERVRVLLGNGLMASEGERWRSQRRMLQAGFHRVKIEAMLPVYIEQARHLSRQWLQAAIEARPVNVSDAVSETTLMAVLRAVFSEDLTQLKQDGANPFALVSEVSERNLRFAMKFRQLGKVIQVIIDRRRQSGRFPMDLLSHMMQARDKSTGRGMSDRQLIDEVLTLIVAGHETTAASLDWLWYLLAAHPATMDKVCEEARSLDFSTLDKLQQLEHLVWIPRVIKEALRLYPPGWLYTRRALRDDRLGEYAIPAGTDVFICAWLLHRHPAYWPQADAFMPERFSREQEARRNRYTYLPFSAGPRHCIGERFAMTEMMVHLGVIAGVVRPQTVPLSSPAFETDVNLRPRDPLFLEMSRCGPLDA